MPCTCLAHSEPACILIMIIIITKYIHLQCHMGAKLHGSMLMSAHDLCNLSMWYECFCTQSDKGTWDSCWILGFCPGVVSDRLACTQYDARSGHLQGARVRQISFQICVSKLSCWRNQANICTCMFNVLGTKWGPTDRLLFVQIHLVKILLLWEKQLLMKPPHVDAMWMLEARHVIQFWTKFILDVAEAPTASHK